MGFFLVRPIPLPVQDSFHIDEGRDQHQLDAISSALDPHDSSSTPLLDHDDFAGGMQGSHSVVLRTGIKSARIDEEVYTLDDVPFRSPDGVFISSQLGNSNREVAILKPNLHGRHLWTSSDFWLLFTILAIRMPLLFPSDSVTPTHVHLIFFFCSQRNWPDVYVGLKHAVDDGADQFIFSLLDINNVGTISQVLYVHQNSKYDEVKASDWQTTQVSLISLMSFSGRILIGIFFSKPLSSSYLFFFKGLISDLIKNKYGLPRSYLLVPIATLFFISQLILATVDNITQLWIASLLLGLAHGSLYSLYPTVCLEWFGMSTSYSLSYSYPDLFIYSSSAFRSFINSSLFWKLGIFRDVGLSWRKYIFLCIWTKLGCSRSSFSTGFTVSPTIYRPSPMLGRTWLLCGCYLSNFISNLCFYRTLHLGWIQRKAKM